MEEVMEVSYVFQDLHNLPEGYEVPEGRVKPWGTDMQYSAVSMRLTDLSQ